MKQGGKAPPTSALTTSGSRTRCGSTRPRPTRTTAPAHRERVVTQALTAIAQDSVAARTMRALAMRLGVVLGALYHHVAGRGAWWRIGCHCREGSRRPCRGRGQARSRHAANLVGWVVPPSAAV
jgi:hypothetical protein